MDWKRSQVVLAGMAAGGMKAQFNPVQIQKLFFIFDRVIPDKINGPHFAFAPYHFGPFDKAVYDELYALRRTGKVDIDHARRYQRYSLTETGFALGEKALMVCPPSIARYFRDVAQWIQSLTFQELLKAIYARFPEMAQNSLLPHLATASRVSPPSPLQALLSGLALIDFTGTPEEYRQELQPSAVHDLAAISSDWAAVGNDLRYAMAFHIHASEHER